MILTLSRRSLASGNELVLFDDGRGALTVDSVPDFLGAVIGEGFVAFFNPPAIDLEDGKTGRPADTAPVHFSPAAGLHPDRRAAMVRRAFQALDLSPAEHQDVYFVCLQESALGPLDADSYAMCKAASLDEEVFSAPMERLWGNPPTTDNPVTAREDFSWEGLHAVSDALALQFPSEKSGASIAGNVQHVGSLTLFPYRSQLFGSIALPGVPGATNGRSVEFGSVETLHKLGKIEGNKKDRQGRIRFAAAKGGVTQVMNPKAAKAYASDAAEALAKVESRVQALSPFAANKLEFVEMVAWLSEGYNTAHKQINDGRMSVACHASLMRLAQVSALFAELLGGPDNAPGSNGLTGVIASSGPPELAVFAFAVGQVAQKVRDAVTSEFIRAAEMQANEAGRTVRSPRR